VVILDLNTLGTNGDQLKSLCVVVLLDRRGDINHACELGVNSFLTKPIDFERFVQVGSAIVSQWLWSSNTETADQRQYLENSDAACVIQCSHSTPPNLGQSGMAS
jgi:hypothetical protein